MSALEVRVLEPKVVGTYLDDLGSDLPDRAGGLELLNYYALHGIDKKRR
jgi:hypothetical protein